MKFLPFQRITLETKLTEEEIMSRLSDYIEPDEFLLANFYKKRDRPYQGKINGQQFEIQRIATNGRDIPPVIIGEIENIFGKTIISLKVRITISQAVVLFLFSTVIGLTSSKIFFFLAIIHSYIFIMYKFNGENSRAKLDLMKLLEAREV